MKLLRLLSILGLILLLSNTIYADSGLITTLPYSTRADGYAGNGAVSATYDTNPLGDTIVLTSSGNVGVLGASASSYASLPGNSFSAFASADTYGFAFGDSGIWDTLWFSNTSPGDFMLLTLSAHVATDGINNQWAYAILYLTVGNGVDYLQSSFLTNGPFDGNVTIPIWFPLKDGPIQFVAFGHASASASIQGGVVSSFAEIDPNISLAFPYYATMYSESGTQYPITPLWPVPEPGSLSILAITATVTARRFGWRVL